MELIDFIKRWEGVRYEPYICPAGVLTIGIGHTKFAKFFKDTKITDLQVELLFNYDIFYCRDAIRRLVVVPLSNNQNIALESFIFNLGSGAFQRSTLRSKLNRKDYEGAAREFPKWCWASGIKMKGLERRRIDEMNLFIS